MPPYLNAICLMFFIELDFFYMDTLVLFLYLPYNFFKAFSILQGLFVYIKGQ